MAEMGHDARMAFALLNLVGRVVKVTKTDGTVIAGVFTSTHLDKEGKAGMGLRYCTVEAGKPHAKFGPRDRVKIPWAEVETVFAAKAGGKDNWMVNESGGPARSSRVNTDKSIGARRDKAERDELMPLGKEWLEAPAAGPGNLGKSGAGQWDQFRANEKFGVRSTYKEELYTTPLNKAMLTPEQILKAERIARDIEASATSNSHVAEERGGPLSAPLAGADEDEEAKYGAVVGTGAFKQPSEPAAAQKPPTAPQRSASPHEKSSVSPGAKRSGPSWAAMVKEGKVPVAAPKAGVVKDEAAEKKRREEEIASFRKFSEKFSSPSGKPSTRPKSDMEALDIAAAAANASGSPASAPLAGTTNAAAPTSQASGASAPVAAAPAAVAGASIPAAAAAPSGGGAPAAEPATSAPASGDASAAGTTLSSAAEKAKKLNPNAKAFTLNPNTPSFSPAPNFAPPRGQPRGGFMPVAPPFGQPYPMMYATQPPMGYVVPMGFAPRGYFVQQPVYPGGYNMGPPPPQPPPVIVPMPMPPPPPPPQQVVVQPPPPLPPQHLQQDVHPPVVAQQPTPHSVPP